MATKSVGKINNHCSLGRFAIVIGLAAFLCTSCNEQTSFSRAGDNISYVHPDGSFERRDSGDRIQITLTNDRGRFHAVLQKESDASDERPYRIYHIEKLEPADSLEPKSLHWLFQQLPASIALRTDDGKVIEHPDHAVLTKLLKKLESDSPPFAEIIDGMTTLMRPDSRREAFVASVQSKKLDVKSIELFIDAVEKLPNGPLIPQRVKGDPPFSSLSRDLYNCVSALAQVAKLDRSQLDRVAAAIPQIGSSAYERRILVELIGKASTTAILESTKRVGHTTYRYEILASLSKENELTAKEANQIAAATPMIGVSTHEAKVLMNLIGRASVSSVIASVKRISFNNSRYKVLYALAKQKELTDTVADQIADATPSIGSSTFEANVLLPLVGKASTRNMIDSAKRIRFANSRHMVLLALAKQKNLSATDANLLASACPSIGSSTHEADVLVNLTNTASTTTVLSAAKRIRMSTSRYQVFDALADNSNSSADDADKLATACPAIRSSTHEAKVLSKLVDKASVESILDATKQIRNSSSRYLVFSDLANSKRLSTEDADAIATATPSIGYSAHEAKILVSLVRRASAEKIANAARKIRSPSDRLRVLEAVAPR